MSRVKESFKMELPKFFELTGSSRDGTDSKFRLYVELTDEDKDFWESQLLDTPEGSSRMAALQRSLLQVLPDGTRLSKAPVASFSESHTETIIANSEPVITKDGRRAWVAGK
jgi:hypothetical protein